jgi:hypothetical protein
MAELFVSPFREVIKKDYDIMSFTPDKKDEGYTAIDLKDPSLADLCHGVIMICSNYAYRSSTSKYHNICYNVDTDCHHTKRLATLKIEIPDITDTGNIIKIRRLFKDYLDLYDLINTTRGGEENPIDKITRMYGFFMNKVKGFNPYIADKLYLYAKSTMSRCINFLLYSILYNIGAGLKNGIQQRVTAEYLVTTIYEIIDSKEKISFKLEIDNRYNYGVFTISSEIDRK